MSVSKATEDASLGKRSSGEASIISIILSVVKKVKICYCTGQF